MATHIWVDHSTNRLGNTIEYRIVEGVNAMPPSINTFRNILDLSTVHGHGKRIELSRRSCRLFMIIRMASRKLPALDF